MSANKRKRKLLKKLKFEESLRKTYIELLQVGDMVTCCVANRAYMLHKIVDINTHSIIFKYSSNDNICLEVLKCNMFLSHQQDEILFNVRDGKIVHRDK